jgi:DEAD/DEAH box helicase domain-containing protein
MFEALLRELREDAYFRDALAAARTLPARAGEHAPAALRDDLAQAVARLCPAGLYTHQAAALAHARAGDNVVVATPTASGKTLCFNLPVLEETLAADAAGGRAHALYLFPLKALEQDQLKSLHRLRDAIGLHESFRAAILDGDTKDAERRRLRAAPPDILLSNPDMLHASLLPAHPQWADFYAGLRYVVLDELHTYRGVFGSHVLHVLRRLRRVAAHYGAAPQFLCASATIRNPRELASALFGVPFVTVEQSGAPQGPRHVLLLNPDENALGFAAALFARCLRAGIKTIAFCKSRRATELLYTWTIERHPELRDVTSAYRSGYLPEERREIEAALFGGHLRGVVSTSALEMGIDVGGLDAAILVGYPGSIMSTWQRGGRAGRGTAPAGVFVVAGADALDQYYATKPEAFFTAPPEPAIVDKTNATIAAAHLLCAAAELPLRATEPAYDDLDWSTTRLDLQTRGLLLQSAGREMWVPLVANPHRQVDIRQIGETYTIHPVADERQVIGTVGGSRAFAECHAGAVYLHRGQHLQVLHLDADRRRVTVDDADGSFFTMARSAKQTEILSVTTSRPLGTTHVHYGRLRITQRITGYEKRSTFEQKLLGVFELELPPTIYETEGLWIEAEPARMAEGSGHHRMGSLHGLEHALIALAPLHTLCDAADLGGITFVEHPQVPGGAVFVYDAYPGGLGLAARTFEVLPDLLDAVLDRIENCRCESGCPGCVHSPRCGAGNYPLDKPGTALALRLLLGRATDIAAVEATATPPAAALEGGAAPSADAPRAVPGPAATLLQPPPGPRVLYFDLETLRSAADVGGWHHIDRMGMALGVVFDSHTGEFTTYREAEVGALVAHLDTADLVVGYNVLRFDYQVLSAYEPRDYERLPTFDMLVALKAVVNQRLALANVGTATLARGKSADGLQSLRWVRDGRLDLVERYCRDDVALTRDVFEFALAENYLAFELGGRVLRTPPLGWNLQRLVQDAARRRAARVRGGQAPLFGAGPPRPTW